MVYAQRLKKIQIISLVLISVLLFIPITQAMALFGPRVVDVTKKMFSVVWTTEETYSSCGIHFYTDSNYNIRKTNISPSQIIVETEADFPGEDGRAYGIVKINVVGLGLTTYYFRPVLNGNEIPFDGKVKIGDLGGSITGDIVHKILYKSNNKNPALGALVLLEIMDPDLFRSNPNDPNALISAYPISGWVGDGMTGDKSSMEYDSNNISYKQYAALNMNNLYSWDYFPPKLHGDNPNTPEVNEGEIIQFTIVHGKQDVLGQEINKHWFTSYGHIGFLDSGNSVGVKISVSFRFKKGINCFAFPCTIPSGYTTGDLLKTIEDSEEQEGIVESIYVFENNAWVRTSKINDPNSGSQIINIKPLLYGQGAFIIMNQDMTKEISFYGKPESASLNLLAGTKNIISLPQLPLYYETGHLLIDIESAGAGENSVENIWSYNGEWKKTYKIVHPLLGQQIQNSFPMSNTKFYFVVMKETANDLLEFDPFKSKNKSRLRSSKYIFFY